MSVHTRRKQRLGRKERKQKRKNRPPPVTGKLTPTEELVCREWGRIMAKTNRLPKKWQQKKVHCEKCKRNYCLGGGSIDVYCDTCYTNSKKKEIEASGGIFTGCQKELTGNRICQKCGG